MTPVADRSWYPQRMRIAGAACAGGAIASAIALGVIAALLVINHYQTGPPFADDFIPRNALSDRRLAEMKARLVVNPKDAALRDQIRRRDTALRAEHFRREATERRGAWLLLGVAVVGVALSRLAVSAFKRLPAPQAGPSPRGWPAAGFSAVATGAVAAALIAAVLLGAGASVPPAAPPPDWPSRESVAMNWPRFRGPGGTGVCTIENIPTNWHVAGGKAAAWTVPLPLSGNSSPIVWGDRVFLTAADESQRQILCYDAGSGRRLWTHTVGDIPGRGRPPETVMDDTGHAAPTPVTDGKRVVALFANGDLVCTDVRGTKLWARNLGTPENNYGHASSLEMYRNLVLVQYDQGRPQEGRSFLLAYNVADGRPVYRRRRDLVGESWTSPILIFPPGGPQLITCSNPWVIAHNPRDGQPLWRAKCLAGDGAPSPTFDGRYVLAANEGQAAVAIRPDGSGDVTKTHIVWRHERGLPDIASPLSNGRLAWLLTTDGILTCLDAQTGRQLWRHELKTTCISSPSLVDGRLYVIAENGKVFVIAARDTFALADTADLGQKCRTSPAFAPGRVYLRGEKDLICISGGRP